MLLILIAYIAFAGYLTTRLPPNDMERSMLDMDHFEMADRWSREFGRGEIPRRMPFRLPLEYALWAWAESLIVARCVAMAVSSVGMWIAMTWAGPVAGLIVLSSPALVKALSSATYVPYVATLWAGGLYALSLGWPSVAIACAVALAVLRPTAWGMALALLVLAPWAWSLPVLWLLVCYLWGCQREVVLSQGWARLLRGESCPVRGIPRDGWVYGLRVVGQRYWTVGVAGLAAVIFGHWDALAMGLLALTCVTFMTTHLPRALIRPKWVVGYMPEWGLGVAVAMSMLFTS